MHGFDINQISNKSVRIGGVRLLTDFTTEQVAVRVTGGVVTVTGEKLKIALFSENEIEITGVIANVETNASHGRNKN